MSHSEQYFFSFVYCLYSLCPIAKLEETGYMAMVIDTSYSYYMSLKNDPQALLTKVNFCKHFLMFVARTTRLFGVQETGRLKQFSRVEEMLVSE